jgi:predicted DNA-binding protein (MmcQ/YjbR family)
MVTMEFPFDANTAVWKVAGKMFCLGDITQFDSINLKCDPEKAVELREQYTQVEPGFHMNKTHWNTVYFEGLTEKFICSLIDHSYAEVSRKLPKKILQELQATR